jgi:hypothetical protein
MTLALLTAAAAAPAAAVAAPARTGHAVPDPIVVRPQVGIAGVALGDRPAQVRARLGAPVRIARERQGATGIVYERWFYRGLRIGLIGGAESLAVLDAATTSPTARTPRGVGVGSPRARVRRDYPGARCTTFRRRVTCAIGEPGLRQTGFQIRRGRVRTIFVADVF